MMRNDQSGNVMVIILITIVIFAALIMTFTRSGQQGSSNMSQQQARLAAQELVSFFSQVDSAFQRLLAKGCSENDISFANSGDTGVFVTANHPASAPGDYSCHIFRPEGGKVTFNMDWKKYQLPYEEITPAEQIQWGNIYFRTTAHAQDGVGTSANELMSHFNFVKPEICSAFNQILYPGTSTAAQPATAYPGKYSFCVSNIQIRNIWAAH